MVLAAAGLLRAATLPPWEEVLGIVRTNLAGVGPAELNDATVRGLLQQYPSRLILETNRVGEASSTPAEPAWLARTNLFDDAYAYLRVAEVRTGLAAALAEALTGLGKTSQIKGLLLDFRFAQGEDFAEAGRTADLFASREQPLVDWGSGSAHATAKTNAIALPLALLVNGGTRGAAEALAAALHGMRLGLLIGGTTAGRASVFKEFTLSTGDRLKVAVSQVKVGDANALPSSGLVPDIPVPLPEAEERARLADPYKPDARASRFGTRGERLTEADLVRIHRDAQDPGAVRPRPAVAPGAPAPAVTDPVLLRGLDLLKGLAVVGQREP